MAFFGQVRQVAAQRSLVLSCVRIPTGVLSSLLIGGYPSLSQSLYSHIYRLNYDRLALLLLPFHFYL